MNPMNTKAQTIFAISLLLLNAALAIFIWPVHQSRSLALLITLACFALAWAGSRTLARRRGCEWASSKTRAEIVGAIVFAGLILLGAAGLAMLRDKGIVEDDTGHRLVGVCMGAVLVVMGNAMPKKLAPRPSDDAPQGRACNAGCNAAKTQSVQRFMGWTFVLAGLLYMGIWCFADLTHVTGSLLLAFPAAVALIVIARLVSLRSRRADHGAKDGMRRSA